MPNDQSTLEAILRRAPVVPVLTVTGAKEAVAIARALVAGGLSVIEITLRRAGALDAIRAVTADVEGAVVGAGTVLAPDQFAEALAAGATFTVSPGATPALLNAAEDSPLPHLPAAATASEMMALAERGYGVQKFFPAAASGGVTALRAISGPLPDIRFCPTGGIDATNAPAYLACANVLCVGGSWLAPRTLVDAEDWPAITKLARAAAALPGAPLSSR